MCTPEPDSSTVLEGCHCGNIDWSDPLIRPLIGRISKRLIYEGLQGFISKPRPPNDGNVSELLVKYPYGDKSIWQHWAPLIAPCVITAAVPLLVKRRIRKSNLPKVPRYTNGILKFISAVGVVSTVAMGITASAIANMRPAPQQLHCQSDDSALYPYYKAAAIEYRDGLFVAQMPFIFQSMQFGTRMAIVKINPDSNRVLVYSPIELTEDISRYITDNQLEIAYIMAPNAIHHLFVADWHSQFPNAELIAAPNVSERRPDLDFKWNINFDPQSNTLSNIPSELLNSDLKITVIKTGIFSEEIVVCHTPSKTLLICDLLENLGHMPESESVLKGGEKRMLRLAGMDCRPTLAADFKLAVDRDAYAQSIKRVCEWDFDNIILAHGRVIENNAKDVFMVSNAFVL